MRVKHPRPKEQKNGWCTKYHVLHTTIYVYIGETGRNLMERIKKHKYAVRTINT